MVMSCGAESVAGSFRVEILVRDGGLNRFGESSGKWREDRKAPVGLAESSVHGPAIVDLAVSLGNPARIGDDTDVTSSKA
jgi:hypothetical protein